MTTKPEAIAQIEAALLFIDQINSHEHVQVLLQIDAYSAFKKVTEPTAMREVLDYIAAQDAEIARLRDDLLPLQLFMDSIFGEFPEHGDIDGFDLQDIAESSGLVVKVNTITPCGESCCCAEAGVPDGTNTECLRVQLVMQRARIASAKHTAALTTKGTI